MFVIGSKEVLKMYDLTDNSCNRLILFLGI